MGLRRNVWAERLGRLQDTIALLEDSATAVAVVFEGTSYTAANLDQLYARLDWVSVKSAIEAIEGGAQQYTVLGRSFTRGNLAELYKRERELRVDMTRTSRPGMRVLNPVVIS